MPSRPGPPGPTRREVLRLGGRGGLAGLAALTGLTALTGSLAGCSAGQRDALLAVDPRRVRLEGEDGPVPPRPEPSERERRRRGQLAGALAALAGYAAAAPEVPVPRGRTGGTADPGTVLQVHRVHADVLRAGAAVDPRTGLLPVPPPDEGGPTLPPGQRPAAVLRAGAASALDACLAERAATDADLPLARFHARVATARAAQATGLAPGAPALGLLWPTRSTTEPVLAALRGLLAQEHRARWSFAVVLAWSTGRAEDAALAREDHAARVAALQQVLRRLGAEPVGARATYPTDLDGSPVDGPVSAAALALRCADGVAAASAAVLDVTVDAPPGGGPRWVEAATVALAAAERERWSWGGGAVPLPGA